MRSWWCCVVIIFVCCDAFAQEECIRRIYVSANGSDEVDPLNPPYDDLSQPVRTLFRAYQLIDQEVTCDYHIVLLNDGPIWLKDVRLAHPHYFFWTKSGKVSGKSIYIYPLDSIAVVTRYNNEKGCSPMITFSGAANIHIRNITFLNSTYAFHLNDCDDSTITHCTFLGDSIRGCSSGTIILEIPANKFDPNNKNWFAIDSMQSSGNRIAHNIFENIVTYDSSRFHTNHAIYLSRGSVGNLVHHNVVKYPPGSGIIFNHGFQIDNKVFENIIFQDFLGPLECLPSDDRRLPRCSRYGISVNGQPEYGMDLQEVWKTIKRNEIFANDIYSNNKVPNWNGEGKSMALRYFASAVEQNTITDNRYRYGLNTAINTEKIARGNYNLRINEIMIKNTSLPDENGEYSGWVELFNASSTAVDLADHWLCVIVEDEEFFSQLPAHMIKPNDFFLVWLSGKDRYDGEKVFHSTFRTNDMTAIRLFDSKWRIVDEIRIGEKLSPGSSVQCSPDGDTTKIISSHSSTPNSFNSEPPPWHRLLVSEPLPPGKSPGNNVLVLRDQVWLLASECYQETSDDVKPQLYVLEEQIKWRMVNANLPYSCHSVFFSFKDKMWVIDEGIAYTSYDGISWESVVINVTFPRGTRVLVRNEVIWVVSGASVWKSIDGIKYDLVTSAAPWRPRCSHGFLSFAGKMWFFGGGIAHDTSYYKDVWSSIDGTHWKLETDRPGWTGRSGFGHLVFDDRMWLFGGLDISGHRNDIWFTEDGRVWKQLQFQDVWSPRDSPFSWVRDGSIWIAGGDGGKSGLLQDVWRYTKLPQALYVATGLLENLTYGDSPIAHESFSTTLPSDFEVSRDILRVSGNSIEILGAGEVVVYIQNEGNELYHPFRDSVQLRIAKAPLIVTVPDLAIEFGNPENFSPKDLELTYRGFRRHDDERNIDERPAIVCGPVSMLPPGKYPLELVGGMDRDYALQLVSGSLLIEDRDRFFAFPNPAVDELSILHRGESSAATIAILTPEGRLIKKLTFEGENPFRMEVSDLAPGIYIYQIFTNGKKETGRFSVHRDAAGR